MKTIIMMMIITAGPGHVDVRGHHDRKVGGLGRHWVGVDLAHVVAGILHGHLGYHGSSWSGSGAQVWCLVSGVWCLAGACS